MYIKRFIILFPCLLIGINVNSQDIVNRLMPKPVPNSPNVASINKYGEYPVSYFTGVPDISIPLYEVKAGSLKIPITLSYHASGIKPTDVASWVGAGWALSTGGQISRSINGRPDEVTGGYSEFPLNPSPSMTNSYNYLFNASSGISDLEPDVFSYSMPGRSGKFFWLHNNVPYLFPHAPIKVTASSNLGTFDIIDENGVLSQFGYNNSFESTTTSSGPNLPTGGKSSWYLTQLSAPNSQDKISIDYQTVGSFGIQDISYSFTVIDGCTSTNTTCPPESTIHPQLNNVVSSGNQLGPSSINFPNGKLRFFLSTANRTDSNAKSLDRIEIQNADGSINKIVKFVYSYFTSPNASSAALKLNEVRFLNSVGEIIQVYKFEYFTNSVSWTRGNNSDLNGRDLWGYYNGATTNTNLLEPKTIPYVPNVGPPTTLTFGGGFNRAVNQALVKEGVLKKITYPTGGYTEFEFEPNQYLKSGVSTLAGGLRVSQIKNYEGEGISPIVRTFKYGQNESGFGSPNFWVEQFNYSASQVHYSFTCPEGYTGLILEYNIRSFHSNVSYAYDSYSIMYPFVSEYIGSATGANLGVNKYVFDDGATISDVAYFVPSSGKFYKNSLSWKRGLLTKKTSFDQGGNIVAEISTGYTLYKNETRLVGFGVHQNYPIYKRSCAYDPKPVTVNEVGEYVYPSSLFWAPYSQSTGALLETSRTEKLFQMGDVNKFTTMDYSNSYHSEKLQLIESAKTNSDGSLSKTVNKYPFDLESSVNASSTGGALGIYMLNQKNILTQPIEVYSFNQSTMGSFLESGQVTKYRNNESNSSQVVPDEILLFKSDGALPLASYTPVSINQTNSGIVTDNRYEPRIKFSHYDNHGNLISVKKSNDVDVSYRYGYQQAFPIAEVQNAYSTLTSNDGTQNINFGGSTSGLIQSSFTFTVDFTGTVYLKLGVNGNPSYTTVANYTGISSGSTTLAKNGCGITAIVFANVLPGTYTLTISLTTPNTGVSSLGACGVIQYPSNSGTSMGTTEFSFESFEENLLPQVKSSPLKAYTGNKYYEGDYPLSFSPPNARPYIVEYFYFDPATSKWLYMNKPFVAPLTLLSEGSAIDHVIVRPKDSVINTYTFDPLNGITSSTDTNCRTTHYEYDKFGRLVQVKDFNQNIIQHYNYNYRVN